MNWQERANRAITKLGVPNAAGFSATAWQPKAPLTFSEWNLAGRFIHLLSLHLDPDVATQELRKEA